eukprot:TRINITY_DN5638_c1_g1_i1.p1 TRINITY_DN5638_c1_g1~~TRINITY_DN5638_c1_g1_i1.p1  ORF type:complete len:659 (-),score=142.87 TRINITY_DN5638_c1_g1_i1:30-2006(-)
MGAEVCCQQKRGLDLDWIGHTLAPAHGKVQADEQCGGSSSSFSPKATTSTSRSPTQLNSYLTEIALQIASDRRKQLIEEASLLPVQYEIQPPGPDELPHFATAVHRKTRVVRQLASFHKPRGAFAQERLLSNIVLMQRLSASSEYISTVHELFEDYVSVHVIQEQCRGGTIYQRIFDRQYFTEQQSAMLVKNMLLALAPLHENHLYHGSLTPESFRFLDSCTHAPLKLIDFGIELKAHRWEAAEHLTGGPGLQEPCFPQLFETCKLVFCAPELAPMPQARQKLDPEVQAFELSNALNSAMLGSTSQEKSFSRGLLDEGLLDDVLNAHEDWVEERSKCEEADYNKKFAAGDVWSIGAIAFLFLCGYPPFFAPSRNSILGRIHRSDIAFDPPFWSKISDEAKDFVLSCLQRTCWDRLTVLQALNHPWINNLADDSPPGAMFASFMLNLRRFYRTALIEAFVSNTLAAMLRREELINFLRHCREIDSQRSGFFTASDLKHVLTVLGYMSVAETISERFLMTFRHPGESYIDYVSLLGSIQLRQQRIFQDELWRHFQRVCQSSGRCDADGVSSCLSVDDLGIVFGDPVIMSLLLREIPDGPALEESRVSSHFQEILQSHCKAQKKNELDFRDMSMLLNCHLHEFGVERAEPHSLQRLDSVSL